MITHKKTGSSKAPRNKKAGTGAERKISSNKAMRVMVTFEARFVRTPDGKIYARGPVVYDFLSRYLKVFDEVVVLARIEDVSNPNLTKLCRADGPKVRFCPVPYYVGPWQYLRRFFKVNSAIKKAVSQADAYILRISGKVGSILYRNLKKKGIPYGAEIVADPWDVFSPGSVRFFSRPVIRIISWLSLIRQCRDAAACSYVTRERLQMRYPPGGLTTHYSSIDLPSEVVLDDSVVEKRMKRIEEKIHTGTPLCFCFVGSVVLYKAPDILVEAVSICVKDGMNLELVVVGGGRFLPELKEKVERLGIADNVKFLGNLMQRQAVFEQLDKADLFVLPSRQEGLPRAMVEAMARGLPCIGSSVGGIPELLADEDIVPPADAKALAAKIEEVLADVSRLEQMARRNLQSAKDYTRSRLEKKRIEFYSKVAEITKQWRKKSSKNNIFV